MTHWRNTMVDRPETDGAVYVTGWTISGLAVLGAIVAVWVFGIRPSLSSNDQLYQGHQLTLRRSGP